MPKTKSVEIISCGRISCEERGFNQEIKFSIKKNR
jgi:hypothetical protein